MGSELSTVSAADMYGFIRSPEVAIQTLGKSMALSNLFGCANVQQGEMLAWECIARRMPPFRLKQKYHLFFNQLTQRADDMLAEFHKLGGKSKIVERTSDKSSVRLTYEGDVQTFVFTWTEGLKEPFVYQTTKDVKESDVLDAIDAGKHSKLKLKSKYRSPRSRMQMLWARVVSDGIRAMAPEVNSGIYTPEEIDDSDDGELVDAEYTVVSDDTTTTDSAVADAAATTVVDQTPKCVVERCSEMAEQSINEMFATLGVSEEDRIGLVAKKYDVAKICLLSKEQSHELIEILRGKVQKLAVTEAEVNSESKRQADVAREVERAKHTAPGVAVEVEGPCSEVQIAEAKRLLAELEQSKPGSVAKFVAVLKAANLAKIADLSACECDELIRTLGIKNLEAFIESTLTKREVPFDTAE